MGLLALLDEECVFPKATDKFVCLFTLYELTIPA